MALSAITHSAISQWILLCFLVSGSLSDYTLDHNHTTVTADDCDPAACELPDCRCMGTDIPGQFLPPDIPQMVLLTFDDEVTAHNFHYFQELFPDLLPRTNPNGCPATATFFISDTRTNMSMVRWLVEKGNEIGSHSLTHSLSIYNTWTAQQWDREMQGMRELLARGTGLPLSKITGARTPNLALGGDTQYSMLQKSGFLYDSSMYGGPFTEEGDRKGDTNTNSNITTTTTNTTNSTNNANVTTTPVLPIWPFTLHLPPALTPPPRVVCDQRDCPRHSYPKLWEVPLNRLYATHATATSSSSKERELGLLSCSMADACSFLKPNTTSSEIAGFLRHNFQRHYTSNRAPLMVAMHARWFSRVPGSFQALKDFLREIGSRPDVYQVTLTQMLDWVRHPKPLTSLHELPSWECSNKGDQNETTSRKLTVTTPGSVATTLLIFAACAILFLIVLVVFLALERQRKGVTPSSKGPSGSKWGGNYRRLPTSQGAEEENDNLVAEEGGDVYY